MKNKFLLIVILILIQSTGVCFNGLNFSTSMNVIDNLTSNFSNNRDKFIKEDYSKYILYRAIVLNDFLVNSYKNHKTYKFFCSDDTDELLKLLKWKIVISYSKNDLNDLGFTCTKKINEIVNLMESNYLLDAFYDAYIEYYKYLDSKNKSTFLFRDSLLKEALFKKPDLEALELAISAFKAEKLALGEWNSSVLAARYGSDFGFKNMIEIINKDKESEFLKKVDTYLWK